MTKEELINISKEAIPYESDFDDFTSVDCNRANWRYGFIAGYNNAVEKAKQWIKDNYWTCSSAEEYSEDFVKFMEK